MGATKARASVNGAGTAEGEARGAFEAMDRSRRARFVKFYRELQGWLEDRALAGELTWMQTEIGRAEGDPDGPPVVQFTIEPPGPPGPDGPRIKELGYTIRIEVAEGE